MALVMVGLTVKAAIREERVWLASTRGDEFLAYQRRTAMFVPFVRWRSRRLIAPGAACGRLAP